MTLYSGTVTAAVRRCCFRKVVHTSHMKRTTLMVNEQLLEEAARLAGAKTYSSVVNQALEALVRRVKARQILRLAGSGLWEGNLGQMRSDRPRRKGH